MIDPSGLIFEEWFASRLSPSQQAVYGSTSAAVGVFLMRTASTLLSIPEPTSGTKVAGAIAGAVGAFLAYEGSVNAKKGADRLLENIRTNVDTTVSSVKKKSPLDFSAEAEATFCK